MENKQINTILNNKIDATIVKEMMDEYRKAKTSLFLRNPTASLIYSGRFAEICLAALKYINDQTIVDINKIKFSQLYNLVVSNPKDTPERELTLQVIPDVLKSIYNIRNKKRVAHIKLNNPELIDAELSILSCDWVISQLLMLYSNLKPEEIEPLISSIMERQIPVIEEFEDGEIMVLKKGVTFKDELLLILYRYPKRIAVKELNDLLKPQNKSYITTYLRKLFKEKLIHLNQVGAIINRNGIFYIESNRSRLFN